MKIKLYPLILWLIAVGTVCNAQDSSGSFHEDDSRTLFARNVVSVVPYIIAEKGQGTGLQYEYFLSEKGKLSLYLPLYLVHNSSDVKDNTAPSALAGTHSVQNYMFYAMPGIKYYPKSCNNFIAYAIGASIVTGGGRVADFDHGKQDVHTPFGFVIQNSLNVIASYHVALGLQASIGYDLTPQVDETVDPLFLNFSFYLGYRF